MTNTQIIETLSDITGLAEPGKARGRGFATMVARLMELQARLFGGEPLLAYKTANAYGGRYVWVTSARAERELGYKNRPAREALARAVRWFLDNGYVSDEAAGRVRLELRPV